MTESVLNLSVRYFNKNCATIAMIYSSKCAVYDSKTNFVFFKTKILI
jgi:hypothetical protein